MEKNRFMLYKAIKHQVETYEGKYGYNLNEMWNIINSDHPNAKFWESTCMEDYRHDVLDKEFTVGTAFEINGKVRKVTKVNSKSVYFGRVRFDINLDKEIGTQYITVDGERINADAIINNAEETTTEIKEKETTMAENINNQTIEEEAVQETEVKNDSQAAIDIINKVEAREEAAEAPKYTEYVVMKADQKDTTLWWDIVRKQKGENISDLINPLHEADNPKFVALVAVDKVKKYLDDTTIKGMVQTIRDVTKKYAKVSGINTPTEATAATVFAAIIAAFSDGATEGSWKATPVEDVEAVSTTEENAE